MNTAVSAEAQETQFTTYFLVTIFVLNFIMAHCLRTDTSDLCVIPHFHAKLKATKLLNKCCSEQALLFHIISRRGGKEDCVCTFKTRCNS